MNYPTSMLVGCKVIFIRNMKTISLEHTPHVGLVRESYDLSILCASKSNSEKKNIW